MTIQPIELDVRPHLRKKLEPFEIIMDTVKSLKKEDVFVLHATFKPTPLLGVMKIKGYVNKVQKVEDDHWITTFVHKSQKHLLEELTIQDDEAPSAEKNPEECDGQPPVKENRMFTLDNRGLEPPQPMIRTLAQLEKMSPGDVLVITNDRVPVFLIEELKQLGCTYEIENLPEDKARITIRKP